MYPTSTTAIAALLLVSTLTAPVSAGPHSGLARRRHHGKRTPTRIENTVELSGNLGESGGFVLIRDEKRDTCEQGAWKCVGSELQRCNWNEWLSIQNCTGENIICSSNPAATGCIWTWSLQDTDTDPSATTSISASASASTIIAPSTTATTSTEAQSTSAPKSSYAALSSLASASDSSSTSEVGTPSLVASQTAVAAASTSSVEAPSSSDVAASSTMTASSTATTASTTAAVSSAPVSSAAAASSAPSPLATLTIIGGQLLAGNDSTQPTSSQAGRKHKSSSTQDWYGASSTQDASVSSSADAWDASSTASSAWSAVSATASTASTPSSSSLSTPSSSQDWYKGGKGGAQMTSVSDALTASSSALVSPSPSAAAATSISATVTTSSSAASSSAAASTSPSPWAAASSSSYDNGQWAASSSQQAQSPASSTLSSALAQPSSGGNTSYTGGGNVSLPADAYGAPHYVIYADDWLETMPTADQISSYNRFILAFWLSQQGAVDDAEAWEQFDPAYRQQVLNEYHAAGIALMVSAFGSTDTPTTSGVDPTQCAQELAAWVKEYGLDGVDVDYEDMGAMNANYAEPWIITFQEELRRQLPAPYLISHAPVAPWFTSGGNYPAGAYVAVEKQTGSGINWYNVQFYNQGNNVYEDCYTLVDDSGSEWPDTSVFGIHNFAGVPLDKIVIGKPLDAGAASNGYLSDTTLAICVQQAKEQGWNGGVMLWEWSSSIGNSFMATVRG